VEGAAGGQPVSVMGRRDAYEQFKLEAGFEGNERLKSCKAKLKGKKDERRKVAAAVNDAKIAIDAAKTSLEAKKKEREGAQAGAAGDEEIIDEEEFAFIGKLKQTKETYKKSHTTLMRLNDDIYKLSSEVDDARTELLSKFNEWYASSYEEPLDDHGAAPPPPESGQQEVMDDDEQFEHMQMAQVLQTEPDSLAFVRARKAVLSKPGNRRAANRLR